MRRTLSIDIVIQAASETPPTTDPLVEAIADFVAREWNGNVTASLVYDSDGDPNYQKVWNRED